MSLTIKNPAAAITKAITTNEIKPGTVFRGVIYGENAGKAIRGLFLRGFTYPEGPMTQQLDGEYRSWKKCVSVEQYEEVNATLEIQA